MRLRLKSRHLVIGFLIVVAGAAGGSITKQFLRKAAPKAVSPINSIDVGRTPRGNPIVRTFAIRNDGNAPLELAVKSTSCTCTNARLDKTLLEHGESSTLTVKVDSFVARSWNADVVLATNDSSTPAIHYHLAGMTYELLSVRPPAFSSGVLKSRDLPKTFTVAVTAVSDDFTMDEVKSQPTDQFLAVELARSSTSGRAATLSVEIRKDAPIGQLTRNLVLEIPRLSYVLNVPLSLDIYGDITIQPRQIFINGATRGHPITESVQFSGLEDDTSIDLDASENDASELFRTKLSLNPRTGASQRVELDISVVDGAHAINSSVRFRLHSASANTTTHVEIPITIVPLNNSVN